jgi:RNA polymerase sigma factor (TIGR02999 family)
MNQVTRILSAIEGGDPHAARDLLPLVYDELRKLAGQRMASERAGQTLQATALVHEAYVRLVNVDQTKRWNGRGHFFAAAAEAMRRILVERARGRASLKRGGDRKRLELDTLTSDPGCEPSEQLLALDEALAELDQHDRQAAELVKLRYFAGLTHQEAADTLGIGRRAADGLWALARAWLYRRIGDR